MANITMIPARARRKKDPDTEERPKLKVAAYCRVSTDTEEQATSYEAQVEHYTEEIKKNPEWEFAGIYADDGISGTDTKNRNEFNRMIGDCMAGKVEMIITKSISRFARNTIDCLQYIRRLKDKGIPVYFEKENINTLDAKGELLLTIMASLAQQESQSLSQNVKLGLQFRYQAGKVQVNHKRFLGYTKDEEGNLVTDPEEAAVVRRIYREYLEGSSLLDICRSLMADGILTGAGKEKWGPTTVRKILTNEKYIGDALLQKTYTVDFLTKKRVVNTGIVPQYYVEDSHEAIIPREIYIKVQAELERRACLRSGKDGKKRRTYSSRYALSSLCTCGKCGDVFRRVMWNNRGVHSAVWRCCTRVEHGPKECDAPTIKEELLQKAVVDAINEVLGRRSDVIAVLKEILSETVLNEADGEIKEIDDRMEGLQKELLTRLRFEQSYEDLEDRIDELNQRKQELLIQKADDRDRQKRKEEMMEFLAGQTGLLEDFDDQLVRKLVEQVIIKEDGTFTVIFKSGTEVTV